MKRNILGLREIKNTSEKSYERCPQAGSERTKLLINIAQEDPFPADQFIKIKNNALTRKTESI